MGERSQAYKGLIGGGGDAGITHAGMCPACVWQHAVKESVND